MNTWSINVIGEQSLKITNGKDVIYHEFSWLTGEGAYVSLQGYSIPTLNNLWDEIKKIDPKIDHLLYANFRISRYASGFVFELEGSNYEDIVSDHTSDAQTLLSFLEMLDEIIFTENLPEGSATEHRKLISMIKKLDNKLEETEGLI